MELREALSQIAEIRERLAESEIFRGYRSLPIAFSGVLAIIAALIQPFVVSDPRQEIQAYCILWFSVAGLSVAVAVVTMFLRDHFGGASQTREVTMLAMSLLAPALVAGSLITAIIVRNVPESGAMLPGLWQIILSLGLFASCRLLPPSSFAVAFFYLASGIIVLWLSPTEWALSPWVMGLPFAIGQFVAAGILYWHLERDHEEI